MTPRVIPGASYGEFWPNGFGFAVPWIPGGKDLLFVRVSQGAKVAGQGHQDGHAWEWDGTAWHDRGPCVGTNPVAYSGEDLYISREDGVYVNGVNVRPGYIGSQGIRWIDGAGIHSGDQTYSDGIVAEYTDCGGLRIGQGMSGGLVVRSGVNQYQLAAGSVRFVRANRVGDALAIYYTDFTNGYLILTTEAEILALPPVVATLPQQPPIETPKPEPTPVSIPNQLSTVQAVRAKYPTPLGAQHGAFLIEVARACGGKLFRKDSGDHTTLPNGVNVSLDVLIIDSVSPPWWVDILGNAEGDAVPAWDAHENAGEPEKFVDVGVIPNPGTPQPEPGTPPSGDLAPLLARLAKAEADIAALKAWTQGVK